MYDENCAWGTCGDCPGCLQTEVRDLENRVDDLRMRVVELEAERDALLGRVAALEARLSAEDTLAMERRERE